MFYFIYPLLLLSLPTHFRSVFGHTILSHQAASMKVLGRSTAAFSNDTATTISMQAYSSSTAIQSIHKVDKDSHSLANATGALPPPFFNDDIFRKSTQMRNYQHIRAGFCAMDDNFCSFQGLSQSINVSSTAEFNEVCLLWDTSCSGNRTLAIEEFFKTDNTTFASQFGLNTTDYDFNILVNNCFRQNWMGGPSDCAKYNPPSRLAEWDKIRSWMRSDQCVSAQNEYEKMSGQPAINSTAEDSPSCCGICDFVADNADVYYWPENGTDTSCLSVIGNSVNPFGYGGTKAKRLAGWGDGEMTYWACSNQHPTTSVMNLGRLSMTVTNSIITTAVVTNVGSLLVKVPVYNPWSASPCGEDVAADQDSDKSALSNTSTSIPWKHGNIHARAHLPLIPASITQPNGLPVTTVVIENFTFTSPSIYAKFYGIAAEDLCGQSTMSPTILGFYPGELSTVEGPLNVDGNHDAPLSTKAFEFRDLPCPPRSVMEANWYKPMPGEPYRPLIAMPSQIRQMSPWFSFCTGYFTAYDPPTALKAATAYGPGPTPADDRKPQPLPPEPSITPHPGARKTAPGAGSIPLPTEVPIKKSPKAKVTPVDPEQNSDSQQSSDPKQGSWSNTGNSPEQGRDPNQGSNSIQGPGSRQSSGPKQASNDKQASDPNQTSNSEKGNSNNQNGDPNQNINPTQGSGTSGDPGQAGNASVPGLPLEPSAAVSYGQDSGAVTSDSPKKNSNTNTVGGGTGQNAAGIFSANNAETATLADTSNDPSSNNIAQPVVPTIPSNAVTKDQVTAVNDQKPQPLSHGISIPSTTSTLGAPPITQSNTVISYGPSALEIGTSTVKFAPSVAKPTTTTIANQVITAVPNAVVLAGTTMGPGDSSTKISGTQVALDTAGRLVVNSKTIRLPSLNSNPFATSIGNQTITVTPAVVKIAGTILAPGSPGLTLGGTLVAANPAGQLVVDSKVILPASTSAFVTTIGGQAITAVPAALAIAGTTMSAGNAGVFVNGTLLSLDTAGYFMVGSQTLAFESQSVDADGLITEKSGTGGAVVTRSVLPGPGQVNSVRVYRGEAGALKDSLLGLKGVVAAMAIVIGICIY